MPHSSAYIPRDRLLSIINGSRLPKKASGSVLFVDIVGYTNLIESIITEEGTISDGVSQAERLVNSIFEQLIETVHQYDGSVVAFGGDAITAWFENDDGRIAISCAQTMQNTIAQKSVHYIARSKFQLHIKTAVASGLVQRLVLGDNKIQLFDVLTGQAIRRLSNVVDHAVQGKIVVEEQTALNLADQITVCDWIKTTESNGKHAFVSSLSTDFSAGHCANPQQAQEELPVELFQSWVMAPVYRRLLEQDDHSEAISAEVRSVVVLFLKFPSLDFESDKRADLRLNKYVKEVQQLLSRFLGCLVKVTFDDKGSYLLAAFGAYQSDDSADLVNHALSVAIALRHHAAEMDFDQGVQIGISQGRMLVGSFGSTKRAAYDLLGSETNIANRLMSMAANNEILVSERVRNLASPRYRFDLRQEFANLKGINKSVLASRLLTEMMRWRPLFDQRLIGRESELDALETISHDIDAGQGITICIHGDAGIGKSHLVAEFEQKFVQSGVLSAWGNCASTRKTERFYVWKQLVRSLADSLRQEGTVADNLIRQCDELSTLLETLPDELSERHIHQELVSEMVIAFADTLANEQSLLFIIDDCQWSDEASRQLLLTFARSISTKPILLLLLHRPIRRINASSFEQEVGSFLDLLAQLAPTSNLTLAPLQTDDIRSLVAQKLNTSHPPRLLNELCWRMSAGNPLHVVELIRFLLERQTITYQASTDTWDLSEDLLNRLRQNRCLQTDIDTGELTLVPDVTLSESTLDIPDRLYSLLQVRVDNIPKQYKSTLQFASIIGRIFELDLLAKAQAPAKDLQTLQQYAADLEALHVIEPNDLERKLYAFSSPVMHETIYNNLLSEKRRQSHARVGAVLEQHDPQAVEQLAYHYSHSNQRQKKLYYLDLAAAKSQRESANQTALSFYNQALQEEERVEWLRGKIEVLDILGNRDEQASTLEQLSHYRDQLPYYLPYLYGRYYISISEYDKAEELMCRALRISESTSDRIEQAKSLTSLAQIERYRGAQEKVIDYAQRGLDALGALKQKNEIERAWIIIELNNILGYLYRDRSDHHLAKQHAHKALTIAERFKYQRGIAQALNVFSAVAYQERDIEAAEKHVQKIIGLQRAIGDLVGEGLGLYNFAVHAHYAGAYEPAIGYLEEALKIFGSTKELRGTADARNLLGVIRYELGEFDSACKEFKESIAICEQIGDLVGRAYAYCNLGMVLRDNNQLQAAEESLAEGLCFGNSNNDPYLEAMCSSHLALVQVKKCRFNEAIHLAKQSCQIRNEIGLEELTTMDLTTQALAQQQLGNTAQAVANVDEALRLLNKYSCSGPEYPHWDYFHCADVLSRNGAKGKAKEALTLAHEILLQRAENFQLVTKRNAFLRAEPVNGRIIEMIQNHQ